MKEITKTRKFGWLGNKKQLSLIKKLAINFSSLTLLQISNFIFPLITFPYLVRVLGPENFGLANFALAFLVYFNTVIDYGFQFSATRSIAQSKYDNSRINELFNLTFYSKLILLIPISIIYFIITTSIPYFSNNFLVYAIVYFVLIGNSLFPVWFFQGIEKMHFITIFNIIFRAIAVILIFLIVTKQDDLIKYLAINSGVIVLTGIVTSCFIFFKKFADYNFPGIKAILNYLNESFELFSSQFLIMLYTTSNTFILGLIIGNNAVGYFAGADKIRYATQNIGGIGGQTIFPHISNLFKESKVSANKFLLKYMLLFGALSLIISLVLLLFTDEIVLLILGEQYLNSIPVLRILAFLPFIIFLSNVFGIQFMLGQGYDRIFKKIILAGAVINIILLMILVPLYSSVGTALSILFTEIVITSLTLIFFLKNK